MSTEAGVEVISAHAHKVDTEVLAQCPAHKDFLSRTSSTKQPPVTSADAAQAVDAPSTTEVSARASPEDLGAQAVAEHRAAVEGELLQRAHALDPSDFERLAPALLGAMGYGQAGALDHSGASGDGGIDGIISQDPLGLDRIYLQAKR